MLPRSATSSYRRSGRRCSRHRIRSRPWGDQLLSDCHELLSAVLPLTPDEHQFIEQLNDHGDIAPELLTADSGMQTVLREHPALRWKALNVKKHRGLPVEEEPG